MTPLSKTTIDSCQDFSALNTLISQPGVLLAPHLSTLVAKVTTLVNRDYRDLNFRYIGVQDLSHVCEILSKEKIGTLSKSEQASFERISLAAKDKIREMNSPYKNMPFMELVMSTHFKTSESSNEATQNKLDAICYQLVRIIDVNPLGRALITTVLAAALNPPIFHFVLSFIACKLPAREFYLLLEKAFEGQLSTLQPLVLEILQKNYFKVPLFIKDKCISINLERIYGPSFKDENYKLPSCIQECLEMTLRILKEDKELEKTAFLDNRTAKVPHRLMEPCAELIQKVFSEDIKIAVVYED